MEGPSQSSRIEQVDVALDEIQHARDQVMAQPSAPSALCSWRSSPTWKPLGGRH